MCTAALEPARLISVPAGGTGLRLQLIGTYNRLGGLMSAASQRVHVDTPSVLSVWQAETGGRKHVPGNLVIRFENHVLYRVWGAAHAEQYDLYFRHGGHHGVPGSSCEAHSFRLSPDGPFRLLHPRRDEADGRAPGQDHAQELQYQALNLAIKLAGEEAALQSISMGGPQIMGLNYRLLGYASATAMYRAFQTDERWHVLGFFDFCRCGSARILDCLGRHDWAGFAIVYNGRAQATLYGERLGAAYAEASRLPISDPNPAPLPNIT